jgi:cytochrome c peroxidase
MPSVSLSRCLHLACAGLLALPWSPALAGPGEPLARLGEALFFDTTLSEPPGTSCASCHDPKRAFSADNGSGLGVPRGSRPTSIGFRKAPTLTYAQFAPAFQWVQQDGQTRARGGLFWDGRVDTLAQQARLPLFNPVEMNLSGPPELAARLRRAPYVALIEQAGGHGVLDDPARTLELVGNAIESFERTPRFAPFSSKFDRFLEGKVALTEQEQRGLGLFQIRQKGNCGGCHTVNEHSKNPRDSLFTDFGYHAVGAPRNAELPANRRADFHDLGLCGPQRQLSIADTERWCGAFRTPTLRNIALTAPYGHNGVFRTLREVVAFYATRDTDPGHWYPEGQKFNDLPPQLRTNVDTETPPYHRAGKRPALRDDEVDDIVAFLNTLTDVSGER